MSEVYWTACQTISGREHKVRAEIEKAEYGAFLPTFVRSRIVRGQLCDNEVPLIQGYVIFQTTSDGWGKISGIDGVHGVLAHGQMARRIDDSEIARLMLGHASGWHDKLIAAPQTAEQMPKRKSKKPRPGKRLRAALRRVDRCAA